MRVLIAGIIGAAVSAAAWLWAEHTTGSDLGWLSVLVGLVTGYCVHRAAGANAGSGYLRGALAVVLALAGIVGGRHAYAQWMHSVNQSDTLEFVAKEKLDEEPIDPPVGGENAVVVEEPLLEESLSLATSNGTGHPISLQRDLSLMSMLWMSLAAIIAYIVGKGPDPVAVAVVGDVPPEETQPPAAEEQQ